MAFILASQSHYYWDQTSSLEDKCFAIHFRPEETEFRTDWATIERAEEIRGGLKESNLPLVLRIRKNIFLFLNKSCQT